MTLVKRFGGLTLAVAAILLVAAPGAMAQGLKLDTTTEKVVKEGDDAQPPQRARVHRVPQGKARGGAREG